VFYKCDVQGPACKIWYHLDCVGNNKSGKKQMEQNNVDVICPVCTIAHDSTESAQNTILTFGNNSTPVSTKVWCS